jgi:DNA-binding response OmpR family regulator
VDERCVTVVGIMHGLLAGARILVVEDDALVALDLTEALTDAGAAVVGPATTLAAAFRHATNGKLSAALLDVRLGSETVFPAAKVLSDRGVPLAFHTGDPDASTLARAWPESEVLTKPASRVAIVGTLAKLLTLRKARA